MHSLSPSLFLPFKIYFKNYFILQVFKETLMLGGKSSMTLPCAHMIPADITKHSKL